MGAPVRDVRLYGLLIALLLTGTTWAAQPYSQKTFPSNEKSEGDSAIARSPERADGDQTVRPGAQNRRVLRAQILLDRARFSPGEIDGRYGDDLAVAIKSYQHVHNLKVTGIIDSETWALLNTDSRPLTRRYIITTLDIMGPFTEIPKGVQEQAKLKRMDYESPQELLGEKFHCSPKLLAELNPGKWLDKAGESIKVPNILTHRPAHAVRVTVSASTRTVTAFAPGGKVIAVYPATIGGEHDPLPIGNWTIVNVEPNPWFYYDPVHFWNASPNEATAKLPPGPNNPAGRVWMGLSKPHYGIHGTPDPGRIRHGESAGCIRLTNWDAVDLSHMVRRGTPAILED
jgi:lipoprotein-anchoring transpeptidase ErfK/SrfK